MITLHVLATIFWMKTSLTVPIGHQFQQNLWDRTRQVRHSLHQGDTLKTQDKTRHAQTTLVRERREKRGVTVVTLVVCRGAGSW